MSEVGRETAVENGGEGVMDEGREAERGGEGRKEGRREGGTDILCEIPVGRHPTADSRRFCRVPYKTIQ